MPQNGTAFAFLLFQVFGIPQGHNEYEKWFRVTLVELWTQALTIKAQDRHHDAQIAKDILTRLRQLWLLCGPMQQVAEQAARALDETTYGEGWPQREQVLAALFGALAAYRAHRSILKE